MDGSSLSDLEGLSKLLESSQKASDDAGGGAGVGGGARALGPGDIGPAKAAAPAVKTKAATKDIWGDDDVKEGDLFATHVDPSDKRPEPAYKCKAVAGRVQPVRGQQRRVLGHVRQRPVDYELRPFDAHAALQVSVEMPGTAFKDVSLDVQGEQFLVRAPHYKLALHLQHAVDDKQGSAKWDSDTCTLNVSLPIIRPSDFFHPSMDPSRLM